MSILPKPAVDAAKGVFGSINRRSDVLVLVVFGLAGLIGDGLYDVVSAPFFTPDYTAIASTGIGLVGKLFYEEVFEGRRHTAKRRALLKLYRDEATRLIADIREQEPRAAARLEFDLRAASLEDDTVALRAVVDAARAKSVPPSPPPAA